MKTCAKCKIEKNLNNFSSNKAKKDGKCVYCRDCYAIINKEWRQKNPEKDKKIHDRWKKNNIETVRKNRLRYYYRHKEERNNYSKKYRKKNKDKIRVKNRKYTIDKYYKDINFRLSVVLRGRLWKAINRNSKKSSILTLLGCTIDELKVHLEKQFVKGMNWKNYGKWHIDHIKPCCSFDLTDFEQQKQCFHHTNLQPLWAKDNIRKRGNVI